MFGGPKTWTYTFVYDGVIEKRSGTYNELCDLARDLSKERNCEVRVCTELNDGRLVWQFSYVYGRCLVYE